MFGISFAELGVILLIAIFFIGPKELPTVIRAFHSARRRLLELKNEFTALYQEVLKEIPVEDLKHEAADINKKLQTIIDLEGKEQEAYDVAEMLRDVEASKKQKSETPLEEQKERKQD